MNHTNVSAEQALEKLKMGNAEFCTSPGTRDISRRRRMELARGQHPYAIVLTCSDSRVVPEYLFSAGLGELFVICVAGNVVDRHVLGSVEYAVTHLGCGLVVVLGHTGCGAVEAALAGVGEGQTRSLTDKILLAAGGQRDPLVVCEKNVRFAAAEIARSIPSSVQTVGAVYDLESGIVRFMED